MTPTLPVIAYGISMKEEEKKKVERYKGRKLPFYQSTILPKGYKQKQFNFKGLPVEFIYTFQSIAKRLNIKYNDLLMDSFAYYLENHSHILEATQKLGFEVEIKKRQEETFTVRNPNVGKILNNLKKLQKEGRLDRIELRIEPLQDFLKDKTIPSEQKAEIREFLEGLG